MFVVGIDDRNIIGRLHEGRKSAQVFGIRVPYAVTLGNDVVARIGEITERAATEDPRPFDPVVQVGLAERSRLPDCFGADIFGVGKFVIL